MSFTIKALFFSLIIFTSCEFSFSTGEDDLPGSTTEKDGLDCSNVTLELNGGVETRTEFVYGENIDLIFNNITGLTEIDGKTFPGFGIAVLKNGKDTLLSELDLIPEFNNGTDLFPLKLNTFFRAVFPYKNNDQYKIHVKIWDKKGDGTFFYELPFTMKKNELFEISSNKINYEHLYLWDQTKKEPVLSDQVNGKDEFVFILNGVEGLKEINGKAFPIFTIEITENDGTKLVTETNLLESYKDVGVDSKTLKGQLSGNFSFTEGNISNPCKVKVTLSDQNSDHNLTINTVLSFN